LGADYAGRIYVVVAAGVAEREAAVALLAGDTQRGGKARARAIVSAHERKSLRRWDWFVAVHGKRPPGTLTSPKATRDGSSDEDNVNDGACWWGFSEPAEIRKLADWVAHANGLHEGADDGQDTCTLGGSTKRSSGSVEGLCSTGRSATTVARADDSLGPLSPLSSGEESEALTPLSSNLNGGEPDVEPLSPLTSDEDDGEDEGRTCRKDVSRGEVLQLAQGLREYADVLEWRVWRMEPDGDAAKGAAIELGQVAAVRPDRFYS
jgi:hypothetical protein